MSWRLRAPSFHRNRFWFFRSPPISSQFLVILSTLFSPNIFFSFSFYFLIVFSSFSFPVLSFLFPFFPCPRISFNFLSLSIHFLVNFFECCPFPFRSCLAFSSGSPKNFWWFCWRSRWDGVLLGSGFAGVVSCRDAVNYASRAKDSWRDCWS